jgi:hypothetical protein
MVFFHFCYAIVSICIVQDMVKQFSAGEAAPEEGGGATIFSKFLAALVDIIIEIPVRYFFPTQVRG